MTEIRSLYRPGRESPGHGNGAPTGHSKESMQARLELMSFLDSTLPKPLHHSSSMERAAQIESCLNTMTLAERVFLEIEMQSRKPTFYTSDYDPLRY